MSLIILSCRPVCICHQISFSSVKTSQMVRSLYDCPAVPVGSEGLSCRVVVATNPADKKKSPVGVTREGIVYELFFTTLPRASVHGLRCRRAVSASRHL